MIPHDTQIYQHATRSLSKATSRLIEEKLTPRSHHTRRSNNKSKANSKLIRTNTMHDPRGRVPLPAAKKPGHSPMILCRPTISKHFFPTSNARYASDVKYLSSSSFSSSFFFFWSSHTIFLSLLGFLLS